MMPLSGSGLFVLLASAASCSRPMAAARPSDAADIELDAAVAKPDAAIVEPDAGAVEPDVRVVEPDTSPVPDVRGPPDTLLAVDGGAGNGCAEQRIDSLLIPVRGTVRGPKVEGEVCDSGMGTFFLDPVDANDSYSQDFFTSTWVNAPYSPTGYAGSGYYGFLMRMPADAQSAYFEGTLGVRAAEVGIYDSTTNCGSLDFEITLPIPSGVICTTEIAPCDPGCEGYGELWVCGPAHPRVRYSARSTVTCESSQSSDRGSWSLSLTSVSAYVPRDGYKHHDTHGHLDATLVNGEDPLDYVVLSLDF
jgi:hypothetical protein